MTAQQKYSHHLEELEVSTHDRELIAHALTMSAEGLRFRLELDREHLERGGRPHLVNMLGLNDMVPDRWRLRFTPNHVRLLDQAVETATRRIVITSGYPESLAEQIALWRVVEAAPDELLVFGEEVRDRLEPHIDWLTETGFEDGDHLDDLTWKVCGFRRFFTPFAEW